jgi:hypothetical protein
MNPPRVRLPGRERYLNQWKVVSVEGQVQGFKTSAFQSFRNPDVADPRGQPDFAETGLLQSRCILEKCEILNRCNLLFSFDASMAG